MAARVARLEERDEERAALLRWWREACAGAGRLVFVSGEAGAGKTALLEQFLGEVGDARVLHGACDPLATPVPLGPFLDMAPALPPEFRSLVRNGDDPVEVRRLFLDELTGPRATTLVVIEDAHWADAASLDLLRYVGRRLAGCRAMVVVTIRSDEVGPRHPVRVLAGDVATSSLVRRLTIPPLSPAAVARLAGSRAVDAGELHRRTGGNAFFVSEVLAAGADTVPASIRDAVLARAARLSPPGREVLDVVACLGPRAVVSLVAEVSATAGQGLDECLESGLLVTHGQEVAFRHDLVRTAVEQVIPPAAASALHRAILTVLAHRPPGTVEVSLLVEHAQRAGDRHAVAEYSRLAAERAAALGAHAQAAEHYARALSTWDTAFPRDRAELLEGIGHQCYLSDDLDASLAGWRAAVESWRVLGDVHRLSGALVGLAVTALLGARWLPLGVSAAREAVDVLDRLPPSPHLAAACGVQGKVAAIAFRNDDAIAWGERGLEVSRAAPGGPAAVFAMTAIGVGRAQQGDVSGLDRIDEARHLAQVGGAYDDVGLCYFWLHHTTVTRRWYDRAERVYADAIAFVEDQDQETWRQWLRAYRARTLLERGRWEDAELLLNDALRSSPVEDGRRMISMVTLGRLRARRGDGDARALLEQVQTMMVDAEPVVGWLVSAPAALAEAAFYGGDLEVVRSVLQEPLATARERREPWSLGEMAYWLWRAGALIEAPDGAAEPYALQIAGCWREAADLWASLGCPYEQALALADSEDETALRQAVSVFDDLGARPARDAAARRLRSLGVRHVPRRPVVRRGDRHGLSPREEEILRLLAEGLRNSQIADVLFLSERTVEHHVASVLRKLGVSTRTDAVLRASRPFRADVDVRLSRRP